MSEAVAIRALVFKGADGMVVESIPQPAVGLDEVLLDVLSVGICGSDIHGYAGETGRRTAGMVMGHEISAVIVEVGPGVRDWSVGDRVCVNPVIGCRHCPACVDGQTNRCPNRRVIGVAPDIIGAFSERIVVPAPNLVHFDDQRPDASVTNGSLVEPLAVGLNAVRQAGILPGQHVAVIGLGMIGLACVWAALTEGAAVVYAGDVDASRLALLDRFAPLGTVVALDLRTGALDVQLAARGVEVIDAVVDAAGLASTCRDALQAVRPGGVVSLVGMGAPNIELSVYELTANEKSLIGSFCYSEQTFRECAAAVASGRIDVGMFVDAVVSLDDAPDTFRELASRARSSIKTMVLPRG